MHETIGLELKVNASRMKLWHDGPGRHPDTLISVNDLGKLLQDKGKLVEAEP